MQTNQAIVDKAVSMCRDMENRGEWLQAVAELFRKLLGESSSQFLSNLETDDPTDVCHIVHFHRAFAGVESGCITALCQAIALWPVLESAEALCNYVLSDSMIKTSESDWSTGPITESDLEQAINDVEQLERALRVLGAAALLARTRSVLCEVLAMLARLYVQRERWGELAWVRGQYLRTWSLIPGGSVRERGSLCQGQRRAQALGALYGDLHFRAKFFHGAAFVENLRGEVKPTILNLAHAEQIDTLDLDRFAADLTTIRYQFDEEEWRTFRENYLDKANNPEARVVLDRVNQRVPADQLDTYDKGLAFADLNCPHWIIRAVGVAIERSHVSSATRLVKDRIQSVKVPETQLTYRIIGAFSLLGIDKTEHARIVQDLQKQVQIVLRESAGDDTEEIAESIIALARLTDVDNDLLFAQAEHCQALLEVEGLVAARHYREASRRYEKIPGNEYDEVSLGCLKSARIAAQDADARGSVILEHAAVLLRRSFRGERPKFLKELIQLGDDEKELPEPFAQQLKAFCLLGEGLLEHDEERRLALFRETRVVSRRVGELPDVVAILDQLLGCEPTNDAAASSLIVRQVVSRDREAAALVQASEVVNKLREQAQIRTEVTDEVADLVSKITESVLPQFDLTSDAQVKCYTARTIGSALLQLPVEKLWKVKGIELLELAVASIDDLDSTERIDSLMALAEGHRRIAASCAGDESEVVVEHLTAAQAALQQINAAQETSPAHQRGTRWRVIDEASLALGQVSQKLAELTYDSRIISEKPTESARHLRRALDAFSAAARNDARSDVHVLSTIGLTECFTSLCTHYSQERYFASGQMEPAFFYWLSEVAGAPVNTNRFIARCAESALFYASDAIALAAKRHPQFVPRAFDAAVDLWALLRSCTFLPYHVHIHCNLALTEAWSRVSQDALSKLVIQNLTGCEELMQFISASCQIDFCRHASPSPEELVYATQLLSECADTNHPLVRGIARRHLRWQDIQIDEEGLRVNGIRVNSDNEQIEISFPSQRRSISLSGMSLESWDIELTHRTSAFEQMTDAVAHLEPMMDFDRLPLYVAVGKGIIRTQRNIATSETPLFRLKTVRIPTPSWDSWVVLFEADKPGKVSLRLDMPYLGKYDPDTRQFDASFPAHVTSSRQTLSFGTVGFSVEILPPNDGLSEMMGLIDTFIVEGTRDDPVVEFLATGCRLLFKAAPRTARCETLFLAKDDGSRTAQCNLVSVPVSSISRVAPSALTNTFAPMFFFKNCIPVGIDQLVQRAEINSLVIVGCPEKPGELSRLLESVYDPALELFFVSEQGDETRQLVDEINKFGRTLSEAMGAYALFRSEVPYVGEAVPLSNFQFVAASRDWAPAAIQMFLDLAHLRRINIDGLPMLHNGKIFRIQTKGNPKGMTRLSTMLRGTGSLENLVSLYAKHKTALAKMTRMNEDLYGADGIKRVMEGRVPNRPVYVLPKDPRLRATLAPQVRLRQAIPIPKCERTPQFLSELRPETVFTTLSEQETQLLLGSANCQINVISTDAADMCRLVMDLGNQTFAEMRTSLRGQYEHLQSHATLLDTLKPGRYAVLASWSSNHATTSIALANYAAAQGGPILFFDEPTQEDLARVTELLENIAHYYGQHQRDLAAVEHTGSEVNDVITNLVSYLTKIIEDQIELLRLVEPKFVGIGSRQFVPYELAGDPALASRYATGHLTGPDLQATCQLLMEAALGEQVNRASVLHALLIGASGASLASVASEIESAIGELSLHSFVRISSALDDPCDTELTRLNLPLTEFFQFAGHAVRRHDGQVSMMFTGGRFDVDQLPNTLQGRPIVFANACSSARTSSTTTQAAQGFATEFIRRGAVNFIGNLWPVVDGTSAEIARQISAAICRGATIGEALLQARNSVSPQNQVTANALVLFGCPRNRLVAGMSKPRSANAS